MAPTSVANATQPCKPLEHWQHWPNDGKSIADKETPLNQDPAELLSREEILSIVEQFISSNESEPRKRPFNKAAFWRWANDQAFLRDMTLSEFMKYWADKRRRDRRRLGLPCGPKHTGFRCPKEFMLSHDANKAVIRRRLELPYLVYLEGKGRFDEGGLLRRHTSLRKLNDKRRARVIRQGMELGWWTLSPNKSRLLLCTWDKFFASLKVARPADKDFFSAPFSWVRKPGSFRGRLIVAYAAAHGTTVSVDMLASIFSLSRRSIQHALHSSADLLCLPRFKDKVWSDKKGKRHVLQQLSNMYISVAKPVRCSKRFRKHFSRRPESVQRERGQEGNGTRSSTVNNTQLVNKVPLLIENKKFPDL